MLSFHYSIIQSAPYTAAGLSVSINIKTKETFMKKSIFILIFMLPISSYAAWISATGKVDRVVTYGHNNTILVYLSSHGKAVTECSNTNGFAISKSIESEARSRMYSMILAAQALGREVTVSYNDAGGCEPWDANSSVYRKITRLW